MLAEYAEREHDATFASEISDFKRLVAACEQAEAMLLDTDAAATSVANEVSQLLLTRVQAFLDFASRTQGDLPVAIKDKWPTANRSDALFLEALRTSELLRTRDAQS